MTNDARELSGSDMLDLRMGALGLTQPAPGTNASVPGAERVSAVVKQLFALQGQDWRASRWALGVRAPGTTAADVEAAFNSGMLVRSWPMRGTVHLTKAEDIGWIQALTGRRVLAGAARRREILGITDEHLEGLVSTTLEALAGGRSLDRDELAQVWNDAGVEWKTSWRYHLIWWMCQNNLTTFGPIPRQSSRSRATPEPRLVLASEWITRPRMLTGDEALCELASRYVRGRGAVRQKDLAWWSMLTAGDAKRGLELAAEAGNVARMQLADVGGADGVIWVDPVRLDTVSSADATRAWHLLAAFDEHLLGFTNREAQLAPEHFERIVPGRNGMFLATVVHEGRTVGTWRRAPKPNRQTGTATGDIEVTAFPGERVSAAALKPLVERWAEFHGVNPPAVRV